MHNRLSTYATADVVITTPAFSEGSHTRPEVRLVGQLGDVARGTMGIESTVEEATFALERAVDYIVPVVSSEPDTCMDDGEAGGTLAGMSTEPRRKTAGGSAMSHFVGDEFTRTIRGERNQLRFSDVRYNNPLDRMRAARQERITSGTVQRAGAHVRLNGPEGSSGCGMADKLPNATDTIIEEAARSEGDRLAEMVGGLMRVPFDPAVHTGIVRDAHRLRADFTRHAWQGTHFIEGVRRPVPGALFPEASSIHDDDIEVTIGEHEPIVLGVNYGDGTLDRDRYVVDTGYKALWIDEPAMWEQAQRGALDPADIQEVAARYQAIMTANIAGGITLAGPWLQVGVVGTPQPAVLSAVA